MSWVCLGVSLDMSSLLLGRLFAKSLFFIGRHLIPAQTKQYISEKELSRYKFIFSVTFMLFKTVVIQRKMMTFSSSQRMMRWHTVRLSLDRFLLWGPKEGLAFLGPLSSHQTLGCEFQRHYSTVCSRLFVFGGTYKKASLMSSKC